MAKKTLSLEKEYPENPSEQPEEIVEDADDFPEKYWSSNNISNEEIDKIREEFVKNNKSLIDTKKIWLCLGLLFTFFMAGLFVLLCKIFCFNQEILDKISLGSTSFWVYLTIKIGFLIVFLALILPLFKTFSIVVYAIVESIERKNRRYVDFTKFLFVLKYKGKIIDESKKTSIININNKKKDSTEINELIALTKQILSFLQVKG